MSENNFSKNNIVIFGGCGFIGIHLTEKLLEENPASNFYLADIKTQPTFSWPSVISKHINSGQIKILEVDVRKEIHDPALPDQVDLIVNLAAVHKQPGHERHEYFDTNIPGAENVCNFATKVNCKEIIFTSSIAVYGVDELNPEPKTEQTPPKPVSPYGQSKFKAEEIHERWAQADQDRKLIIVRPGVIFGPGEQGNVSRMVKAITKRYFIFIGNEQVKKAGGYVKELCLSMLWARKHISQTNKNILLYNFTVSPAPTIDEYATEISRVAGIKKFIPKAPFPLLYWVAFVIGKTAKLIGINSPINAERIIKLKQANIIEPSVLRAAGYKYQYSLGQAMEDWKKTGPEDWR